MEYIETKYTGNDCYSKLLRSKDILIEAQRTTDGIFVQKRQDGEKTNMLIVDLLQGRRPDIRTEEDMDAYMFSLLPE